MAEAGDVAYGAAIVGTGFAGTAHLDALRRLPNVRIVGVLGSTPDRTAGSAARLGVPRAFGSLDELLADPGVAVVHNCTPNDLHAEVASAALDAGKHLVSEKPLGIDAEEAASLADRARGSTSVTAVCFNYRHFPLIQELRSLLASGADGAIHLIHGGYLQDWLLQQDDWNWRLDSTRAGAARAVGDIGSHWIDLVQHVTGTRVAAVCAQLGRLFDERLRPTSIARTFEKGAGESERIPVDTEDMATVLLRFSGGAIGSCTISQVSAGRRNHLTLELDAAEASFAWDQEEPNTLWIGRRDGANRQVLRDPSLMSAAAAPLAHFPAGHQEGWPDSFRNLMIDAYAAVDANERGEPYTPTFATFDEAWQVARVVEAILQSDRRGTWSRSRNNRPSSRPVEQVREPRLPIHVAREDPLGDVARVNHRMQRDRLDRPCGGTLGRRSEGQAFDLLHARHQRSLHREQRADHDRHAPARADERRRLHHGVVVQERQPSAVRGVHDEAFGRVVRRPHGGTAPRRRRSPRRPARRTGKPRPRWFPGRLRPRPCT